MPKIKLNIPPDQTPQEEAELVARVAASIIETHGEDADIEFELTSPEEVDYRAVGQRTEQSSRWNA